MKDKGYRYIKSIIQESISQYVEIIHNEQLNSTEAVCKNLNSINLELKNISKTLLTDKDTCDEIFNNSLLRGGGKLFKTKNSDLLISNEDAKFFKSKFNLLDYHIGFLNSANKYIDFRNKSVLEIGGSNMPKEILFDRLKVKNWVSIDNLSYLNNIHLDKYPQHYRETPIYKQNEISLNEALKVNKYIIFDGITDYITCDFFNKFDVCVSNCCFEHIKKFSIAIQNIYNCLNKDGILYSKFAPIWSSNEGAHFSHAEKNFTFTNCAPLPKFAHLLLSFNDIYDIILKHFNNPDTAEQWARDAKFGREDINRYFYEDYEHFFETSKFNCYEIRPSSTYKIDEAIYRELIKRYPDYRRFDAYGIELIANK